LCVRLQLGDVLLLTLGTEIPMPLRRKRNGNGSVVADNDSEQLAIEGGKQSSAGQLP
jgi:hypothetical protein